MLGFQNRGAYTRSFSKRRVCTESVNRRTDNKKANRKKEKRTNTDLQNTTQKTKDRVKGYVMERI